MSDPVRELAMVLEYDEFYGGKPAPLPEGVAALWGEPDPRPDLKHAPPGMMQEQGKRNRSHPQ